MKKYIVLFFFGSIPYSLCAQQSPERWDLNKCLGYATSHNLDIKRVELQAAHEKVRLNQARLSFFPTVNLTTSPGIQTGRSLNPVTYSYVTRDLIVHSYDVEETLTLFAWGKMRNDLKAEKLSEKAALLDVEKAKSDIRLAVTGYYLQALASYEQLTVAGVQVQRTENELADTKFRVTTGAAAELNLIKLGAQLATDSNTLIEARSVFENDVLTLKTALNIDAAAPFELETPALTTLALPSLADLQPELVYASALEHRAQQKSDAFKLKTAEYRVKSARAAMFPVLAFKYNQASGFYNYISDQRFNKWWTGYGRELKANFYRLALFTINWPVFNNGRYRAAYADARISLNEQSLQQQQDEQQLKQLIYSYYSKAKAALEKCGEAEKIIAGSRQAYELILKGYQLGNFTVLNLISAQNDLLKAQLGQINSQTDYIFRVKMLELLKEDSFSK